MDEVSYLEVPALHRAQLIIGFEGWPNAGEVSSLTIQHLIQSLGAKRFASIPNEEFYQFSTIRPTATVKEGRVVELKFPGNHFYYSKNPLSRDIVLFQGTEPHQRWQAFTDLLLKVAERCNVSQIFTVGGTYDYVPHTFPPVVSALFSHDDLKERVVKAGLGLTDYTGPISIHTFIMEAARKKGVRTISLWGHAPQYLQTKNMKVAWAVLKSLIELTGMEIDLSEIERTGDYFDQQVRELVAQDPKLREVIGKLEEVYKRSEAFPHLPSKGNGSKEEKVVYMEAFLKRQEDEDKKES
jgi:proteasome assembly chaperone (PAC2) family protein